jgi:pimeloyl-ACP methyl ester carboxylesterase
MPDFRMLNAGGTRIRAAIQGEGPLVIMVHGFPESWYSWRHQIGPIAEAGFTACAIDVRGYGGSAKPPRVEDYSMENLVADVAGVADALQPGRPAILIGHDWGAPIVWNSALTRPERFGAVAALSVVHTGVPTRPATEVFDELFTKKNRFFYQVYFQQVGRAEHDFDCDPRDFLATFYHAISGDAPKGSWPMNKTADATLLDGLLRPPGPSPWMTTADLDYYVEQFVGSGFFGPISRYRNHERDFAWLQQFRDRKIEQPAFFVAGDKDGAFNMFGGPDPIEIMRQHVTDLQGAHVLPGCGHWTQQEQPAEVNALLIPWLKTLAT